MLTVEAKPENAAVAKAVVEYAGVQDRVEVFGGRLAEDTLADLYAALGQRPADLIFMDHFKDCYKPDLQAMEELGLLRKGTVVVADNVVYPGAPGYLEYVDTANGRYTTELLPAAFEYEQKWKSDWDGPKADALSVSIYNGRD
jgi:catechol O-methyltransferase